MSMATPQHHNTTSGCFSAVLRRILCREGLPTHPSDHIADSKPAYFDLHQKQGTKAESPRAQSPAKPGVVARLMGLESLPETNSTNRVPNGPDSVSRSRSVNFMDYLLKFDFADPSQQQKHRRVRSSVSFREVPEAAPAKPSEVFVLYLERVGEEEKVGSRQRKSEVGTQNLKKQKSREVRPKVAVKKEKVSKLKDEPRRASVQRSGAKDLDFVKLNKKQISRKRRPPIKAKASTKLVTRKEASTELEQARKKTEHDQCSSVDLSPVSVFDLDLSDFSIHQDQTQFPAKLGNHKYQFPIPTHIEDAVRKDKRGFSNEETEDLMELRSKLCRLAEEDIEESKWSSKDETEDLRVELGVQIFNQLLEHVVDELVSVPF